MALDPEKLRAIINAGDMAACLAFFQGASEADRKAVAKVALDISKAIENHLSPPMRRLRSRSVFLSPIARVTDPSDPIPNSVCDTVDAAVLASASLSQLKSKGFVGLAADLVYTILADRPGLFTF